MKEHQARGIVLSALLEEQLAESGQLVRTSSIAEGLAALHRPMLCALSPTNSPLLPPVRMIGEVKYHSQKIECAQLYDFAGILHDVEALSRGNAAARYQNVGCVFSATSFSTTAQKFAWANGIALFSFESSRFLRSSLLFLQDFIRENAGAIRDISREELIKAYHEARTHTYLNQNFNRPAVALASLGGIYPVLLCGEGDFLSELEKTPAISAAQVQQYGDRFEMRFDFRAGSHALECLIPTEMLDKVLAHPLTRSGEPLALMLPLPGGNGRSVRIDLPLMQWEQSTI